MFFGIDMPWIVLAIIFGIILLIQFGVYLIMEFGFHRRSDNDPNLKYFTVNDFDDIAARPIEFKSGKNTLRGFVYTPKGKTPNRLLVFTMGIGAGHHAYMHVIREMVLHDYQVLSFDYTGAELSDGKYIKGLPQALLDLKAAFRYIASDESLKNLPVDVMGHSWGGYASGIAPRLGYPIRRVVSISGFNSVPSILASVRTYMRFFEPFMDLVNLMKFGKVGLYDILSTIKHTSVPMLFINGKNDPFVKEEVHFDRYRMAAKDKPYIEFYLDELKGHNPYLTTTGEAYFVKIIKEKKKYDKNPNSPESQAFYKSIDYDLITQNDPVIFKAIFAFLDK